MSARDRYGMRELDHLPSQTGGKSYDSHAMNVSEPFTEISGELRSLYAVAYNSTNPTPKSERSGAVRKVVIPPKRLDIVLRASAGYYVK